MICANLFDLHLKAKIIMCKIKIKINKNIEELRNSMFGNIKKVAQKTIFSDAIMNFINMFSYYK